MEEIKYCSHCGNMVSSEDTYCSKCGACLKDNSASYESGSNNNNHYYNADTSYRYDETSNNTSFGKDDAKTYSTMTLVFGILSVVLGGILWAILGLVFASKADPNDSKTKAGKILSIIGIVLWVLIIIIWLALALK